MSFVGTYTYNLKDDREIVIDVKNNIAKRFRIPTQMGEIDWIELKYKDVNGNTVVEKVEKQLSMACRYIYGLKLTNEFLPFDATTKGISGQFTFIFNRPVECCFRYDVFLEDETKPLMILKETSSLNEVCSSKFLLIHETREPLHCFKVKDPSLIIEYENGEHIIFKDVEIFSLKPYYTYVYKLKDTNTKGVKGIYFETEDIFSNNLRVFTAS